MSPAMVEQRKRAQMHKMQRPHAVQQDANGEEGAFEQESGGESGESDQASATEMSELDQETAFLLKLAENIKNDTVSERIHSIVEQLDDSGQIGQSDYDFLTKLAEHINNQKIAEVLIKIADNHLAE